MKTHKVQYGLNGPEHLIISAINETNRLLAEIGTLLEALAAVSSPLKPEDASNGI